MKCSLSSEVRAGITAAAAGLLDLTVTLAVESVKVERCISEKLPFDCYNATTASCEDHVIDDCTNAVAHETGVEIANGAGYTLLAIGAAFCAWRVFSVCCSSKEGQRVSLLDSEAQMTYYSAH